MNLEHEEGRLTGRKERDLFFFLSSLVGKNLNETKTSLFLSLISLSECHVPTRDFVICRKVSQLLQQRLSSSVIARRLKLKKERILEFNSKLEGLNGSSCWSFGEWKW